MVRHMMEDRFIDLTYLSESEKSDDPPPEAMKKEATPVPTATI